MDNFGFRYYDSVLGKFITRDPSGYPDGPNNYLYCNNNPINSIDPLGLEALWEQSKAFFGSLWGSAKEQTVEMGRGVAAVASSERGMAYDQMIDDSSDRYAKVIQNNDTYTAYVVAANDVTGFTQLGESIYGVDVADQRELSTMERTQRGLMGGGGILLNSVGGASVISSARGPWSLGFAELSEWATTYKGVIGPYEGVGIGTKPVTAVEQVKAGETTTASEVRVAVKEGLQKQGTSGGPRAGKDFTSKGKQEVIKENTEYYGKTTCEECKVETVPSKKSEKGVTPDPREAQVDHVIAKSNNGDGSPSNGQVLCRHCNRQKSNKTAEEIKKSKNE